MRRRSIVAASLHLPIDEKQSLLIDETIDQLANKKSAAIHKCQLFVLFSFNLSFESGKSVLSASLRSYLFSIDIYLLSRLASYLLIC